jgi:hypothetical protein
VARVGEKRNAYSVLVGKSEGKRSLGGNWRRWKNIIKMHGKTWTGFVWLKIGTRDGLLWTRWWILGVHKIRGVFWWTEELVAF